MRAQVKESKGTEAKKSFSTTLAKKPVNNNKKAVRFTEKNEVKEFVRDSETNAFSAEMQEKSHAMNFKSGGVQLEDKFDMPETFGRNGSVAASKSHRKVKEERKNIEQKQKGEEKYSEKYGKGLKMLKLMGGFELGKGVGKNNQGILAPIEAVKSKGGLGFGGKEAAGNQASKTLHEPEVSKTAAPKGPSNEEQARQKLDQEDSDFLKLL